jgi:hypothetical protein
VMMSPYMFSTGPLPAPRFASDRRSPAIFVARSPSTLNHAAVTNTRATAGLET